jgi:hypothetical protein
MKLVRNKEVLFFGLSNFSCCVFETTNVIKARLGTEEYIKRFRVILVNLLSALYTELDSNWIVLAESQEHSLAFGMCLVWYRLCVELLGGILQFHNLRNSTSHTPRTIYFVSFQMIRQPISLLCTIFDTGGIVYNQKRRNVFLRNLSLENITSYEGNSLSKLQIQVATYVFELGAGNCHR